MSLSYRTFGGPAVILCSVSIGIFGSREAVSTPLVSCSVSVNWV
jgi:hypothetical protein